ncbi:MAG: hypothetical protein WA118_01435 [Carboxydocellales bacterium]
MAWWAYQLIRVYLSGPSQVPAYVKAVPFSSRLITGLPTQVTCLQLSARLNAALTTRSGASAG